MPICLGPHLLPRAPYQAHPSPTSNRRKLPLSTTILLRSNKHWPVHKDLPLCKTYSFTIWICSRVDWIFLLWYNSLLAIPTHKKTPNCGSKGQSKSYSEQVRSSYSRTWHDCSTSTSACRRYGPHSRTSGICCASSTTS